MMYKSLINRILGTFYWVFLKPSTFYWTAVAAVLGGSIYSSNKAAGAAATGQRDAAAVSERTTDKNIDFQKWLWGEQTALQQSYMDAGKEGLSAAQDMIKTGFQYDPNQDPSTEFRRAEGQKGVENSASAKGMSLSGNTLRGLTQYNQDYASTEYGNSYNRWQNDLKNQFGLARMGQAAASGVSAAGASMGNQVGSSIAQGGQAQSQMYQNLGNINAANAMAPYNTVMDLGNMAASYYGAKNGAKK